jgi:hypothetical protein
MSVISTAELLRALTLRDLTDPSAGPHAMQLLLSAIHAALPAPVVVHRASPIVSIEDNYDRLGYPADGAARDARYTRYVCETALLRTQTSALIPPLLRELAQSPPDDVVLSCPGLVSDEAATVSSSGLSAVPDTENGTVTANPLAADSCTESCTVVIVSPVVVEACVNATTGGSSSSVIVSVVESVAPTIALTGLARVTISVSSGSSRWSIAIWISISCSVWPGKNVSVPSESVKSSARVAVPVPTT